MKDNRAKAYEDYAEHRCRELVEESVALRNQSFFSQKQVSEALGLNSHGNITIIETGKSIPRLDRFLRLLAVYGYTLKIVPRNPE